MENRIRIGKASDVMTVDVVTGHEDESLGTITGRMETENVSEMPIVDDRGRLKGIIDYRIIVRHRRSQASMKSKHLMFIPPDASPSTPLVDIADHMISHDLRAIPIVDRGNLVGIVSRFLGDGAVSHFLHQWEGMIFAYAIAGIIIFFVHRATRNPTLIPGRLQNLVEMVFEGLTNFIMGILGPQGREFVPFLGTLFVYILAMFFKKAYEDARRKPRPLFRKCQCL